MAPRIPLFTARSVAFRTKPLIPQKRIAPSPAFIQQQRAATDDALKHDSNEQRGASESGIGHVTEEAAAIDKIKGDTPPDIAQGTPVQEVSFKTKQRNVLREAYKGL